MKTNKKYFIKEYGWVADDIKGIISKKDAVKIYNYELKNGISDFFDMLKKDFPKLYRYFDKKGISLLMLNIGLCMLGEIRE